MAEHAWPAPDGTTGALIEPYHDLAERDVPDQPVIERLRERYPTEREADELLTRALARRSRPSYAAPNLARLSDCVRAFVGHQVDGDVEVADARWLTGGGSKIQMGFTLSWRPGPGSDRRTDRLVLRMDPPESQNPSSRLREYQVLRALEREIPVPHPCWVDSEGTWFPEPALITAWVDGVTRPADPARGRIAGVGLAFDAKLRAVLAPQFVEHLARIHRFDHKACDLSTMDRPPAGSDLAARWLANRARRTWEQDRYEDVPLMEVAGGWLDRNVPLTDRVSIVHGDFRAGNFLFDPLAGRITAWLDWERCFLGDRHRDLAWTTQSWLGSKDHGTVYVSGLMPAEAFYDAYEDRSGLSVDQEKLAYYRVLNAYQMVAASLGTKYRIVRMGRSHHDILLVNSLGYLPLALDDLQRALSEVL